MTKIAFSLGVLLLIAVDFCAFGKPSLKALTLCQVLKDPTKYDRRIMKITVRVSPDWEYLDVWDPSCVEMAITLTYPEDPTVQTKPGFVLKKDAQYDLFEKLISAKRYPPTSDRPGAIDMHDDPTLATPLYDVQATITGRFESGDVKDKNGQISHAKTFGHMNEYHARIVVQGIENVVGLPREPRHTAHPHPDDGRLIR